MTHVIVAGVDGSPHSDAALRWSLAQAEALGGRVVAVFAWQLPYVSIPGAYDHDELAEAAKNFLVERLAAVAPEPRVQIVPLVAEGDPAAALAEASNDADLLAVGVRGRSPFVGMLMGAVAQRCAAIARCPVVIVKPPADPGYGGETPSTISSPG
jgi:nucleotide-binding universal stress UspA family protein